ncbi:hypothetical protein [Bdellovibrio sp. HCB209]|uniref:hypothetical protein n=1 Tax=Bdellovibrio sp. HCB209 TaxID=3394354 RepID=UPI0039B4995B
MIGEKSRQPMYNIKFSKEGIAFVSSQGALLGAKEKLLPWDMIESAEIKKRLGMTYLCLHKKNAWFKWMGWKIPLTGALWDDIAKGINVHAPKGHTIRKLKALSR